MSYQIGSARDISLFRSINRELINQIIQQEIGLYQLSLDDTKINSYGESTKKQYYQPIFINALINWKDQDTVDIEIGQDRTQGITVSFLRDDLVVKDIVPGVGDIILWRENYYEIINDNENKFLFGKDSDYALSSDTVNYGSNWAIICTAVSIRVDKLNIISTTL